MAIAQIDKTTRATSGRTRRKQAAPERPPHRIFLLSPANAGGIRAKMIMSENSKFILARRLRNDGLPLGELFSFISGLYFRGKLAYAQTFASPPAGLPGVLVITPARGLVPPETLVTHEELLEIAGVPVDISRTGYTGDLGFEIWMPGRDAVKVWDALNSKGKAFDIHPAGMIALDIARIEAGLILIEVDYTSSKKALIDAQSFSPAEIGLGKLVDLKKEAFVGREALAREAKKGAERALVGLEINWNEVEALYDKMGMAPQVPSMASRVAVPVYRGGRVVGKATSTTWSPTLKKMIALACVGRQHSTGGTTLSIEMTVEAVRHTVSAKIVPMPFFNPARKMAVPVI